MSCIVYQIDKRTGAKYAYESVSYWDKDKKQPRSKRKYIGRVDLETGEIIDTQHKKKSTQSILQDGDCSQILAELQEQLDQKVLQIEALHKELDTLRKKYQEKERIIRNIASSIIPFLEEA